jgi:hypothetical protein
VWAADAELSKAITSFPKMTTEPLYSFQLARGLLKAMALFQADEDRPALACASFEIRKTVGDHHELTLVTIDGRRLASYQSEILKETLWGELPDAEAFVVDLSGCAKLPKVKIADFVTCEVFPAHVEFVADKLRYTTPRLDKVEGGSKFPNWRDIIPSRAPEQVDQIAVNHEMLADFRKAAKLIVGDKGYALALRTFGEGSPISVQFLNHREFYGIIMPLKSEHPQAFPEWLQEEKKRGSKLSKADIKDATESKDESAKAAA